MSVNLMNIPDAVLVLCRTLAGNGYESYLVGGCVRDLLRGSVPHDFDITTNCLPEETMRIFVENGLRVIPVGLKHGTVAVLVDHHPYEVTTYRSEGVYSNGRHPDEVHFLKDLEGDLQRRDLTINAMAYDPLKKDLIDLFHGQADISRKIIRAVGDPEKRFAEDYLRMLRAVRYAARFGYTIEEKTLMAIRRQCGSILRISKERIFNELFKMARESGQQFAGAVTLMKEAGLLRHVLPEIDVMEQFPLDPDFYPQGNVLEHTLACLRQNRTPDPVLNLAILFHETGKPLSMTTVNGKIDYSGHHQAGFDLIAGIARRMKISNQLKAVLQFVALHHMDLNDLLKVSNHTLLRFMIDASWQILYQVILFDAVSRGPVDPDLDNRINERLHDLEENYVLNDQIHQIRKVINGPFIMSIKSVSPGPQLGIYLDKTIEWIVNNSVDMGHIDRIKAYIKSL